MLAYNTLYNHEVLNQFMYISYYEIYFSRVPLRSYFPPVFLLYPKRRYYSLFPLLAPGYLTYFFPSSVYRLGPRPALTPRTFISR